ncbi:hypothetical protein JR316_0010813 [Psilocybe cubensis]|uniref:Uncharacterized protein n=2 Tax=Psilocybe cubensis TaxID=181762 RepID=A0ACB8GNC2_PSICU|nr:hypothetical protein JR316_0010813 [Psilocybe cubensis]KAH9476897.1 hypothetical protein JR316_0010813 [Psilocybe cubensis]
MEMNTGIKTGTGATGGSTGPNVDTSESTASVAQVHSTLRTEENSANRPSPARSPQPTITSPRALSYTTETQCGSHVRIESVDSVGGSSSLPEYRSREVSIVGGRNNVEEALPSSNFEMEPGKTWLTEYVLMDKRLYGWGRETSAAWIVALGLCHNSPIIQSSPHLRFVNTLDVMDEANAKKAFYIARRFLNWNEAAF